MGNLLYSRADVTIISNLVPDRIINNWIRPKSNLLRFHTCPSYLQVCLFVLRFYGPVNPWGHVERGQFT